MKKNIGPFDRGFRIVAAIIILVLYLTHVISGLASAFMLIVAGIFILTSFMGFCPLYFPFGISTRGKINKK